MKLNKYLKELGYKWEDLPGNYNPDLKSDVAAADIRNKEDDEGFCGYEFFSLDHSLALYIYPRLCYFRDHIMDIAIPGCFTTFGNKNSNKISKEGQRMWHQVIEEMCEAFKLLLVGSKEGYENLDQQKINKGLHLFAEYYSSLWY